jgi:hypothetical protein
VNAKIPIASTGTRSPFNVASRKYNVETRSFSAPGLNPLPITEPSLAPAGLQLSQAALYGLAGHAVRTVAPHSEARPAAILLQLLAPFGNAVGPGPHSMVGALRPRPQSLRPPPWLTARVNTARLTTGGLIHALRNQQPPNDRRLLARCSPPSSTPWGASSLSSQVS